MLAFFRSWYKGKKAKKLACHIFVTNIVLFKEVLDLVFIKFNAKISGGFDPNYDQTHLIFHKKSSFTRKTMTFIIAFYEVSTAYTL